MKTITVTTSTSLTTTKSVTIAIAIASVLFIGGCDNDHASGKNYQNVKTIAPTAPTAPSPTLRALLRPSGLYQFSNCFVAPLNACTFTASLSNMGQGCAYRVEGTIRLFGSTGLQLGPVYRFTFPFQQIIKVGETSPYTVSFVPAADALATTSYGVDPVWIDTPCS